MQPTKRSPVRSIAAVLIFLVAGSSLSLAQEISPADRAKIEEAIRPVMEATGLPSASIGIARGGKVIYTEAFGSVVLASHDRGGSSQGQAGAPERQGNIPADPSMAYPIGSNSKAFTAACVLLLQERGKLRLDDPVSRWFPELTRANVVTIRNLLTHTSGYADSAPETYTFPMLTRPISALALVHTWATRPLGFDPGTEFGYSNTNYTIASLIVEKASGMPFHDFLWQNVIEPLELQGVLDLDIEADRKRLIVRGYERHALGPMRRDNLEAPGWYAGAGELAMPVASLLAWDTSILHRTLLRPESYDTMETEFKLKNGSGTGYGMGLHIDKLPNGKRLLRHGGVVSGFVSENAMVPEDSLAYAVMTNAYAGTASRVAKAIERVVEPGGQQHASQPKVAPCSVSGSRTPAETAKTAAAESEVAAVIAMLRDGKLDRSLFTPDTNFYFDVETVEDFRNSLVPLGPLHAARQCSESMDGGMVYRVFHLQFRTQLLRLTTYTMPDGKLQQFLVSPAE